MQNDQLPSNVRQFMRECGWPDADIEKCTSDTALLQDLGVDGDTMIDVLEQLRHSFSVDLTDLEIEKYSPHELSTDALILGRDRIPILRYIFRRKIAAVKAKYKPITLGMIAVAIDTKKWPR